MPTQSYQGKTLGEWMAKLRAAHLQASTVLSVENAMTMVGLTDRFARKLVGRAYRSTLKEGGTNFDLTRDGKWAKTTERWAPDNIGKAKGVESYVPTTVPTDTLTATVTELDGRLTPTMQSHLAGLSRTVAAAAGRNFSETYVEEVISEATGMATEFAAQNRELEIHRQYQASLDKKDQMMERLIAALPSVPNGSIRR